MAQDQPLGGYNLAGVHLDSQTDQFYSSASLPESRLHF